MTMLPDFRLEAYLGKWEFAAKYHLTASDAQSVSVKDLLDLADEDSRHRWDNLQLSYTESYGLLALRESIAATYENVSPHDVICFAGAEEGLYLAMKVLLNAGDHAVVVTPNYQAAETIPLSICDVTGVPLSAEEYWALDIEAITAALRPNTRIVSVNFPNNPTGALPDQATWRALVALCDERDIYLFSDEVYRGLELESGRKLPQAADMSSKALSLNVLSKSYGLPGLRVGWIACRDRSVLDRLERAKHYTSICNSAPSEVLGLIALRAGERLQSKNRKIIADNLPIFTDFFSQYPHLFEWTEPQGGCVAFPRYLGSDGVEAMCARLVEQAGILLLPASIYKSDLTTTPEDRFRVGVGRLGADEALGVWAEWLEGRS
ncbi:aminotransferase class I/II-fold pyridoxal phosphate-dependent enzyme [Sinomonas sp. G460-2]|uniref:aminotransferase class I/II-fold pyridoxal phosphate-dependent enzyme n=1 Tax=Sinomonas sp. G460-2 TaxID=3393464 RepID=UPI0039EDF6F7